eukprot:10529397-Ditylum_brightwellii.AAC.1
MNMFDINKVCKKTSRKLIWERFKYARKNVLRSGTSMYTCTYQSQRKDMEQCEAKLIYGWAEGEVICINSLHLCECCFLNSIGSPEDEGIKIFEDMKEESMIRIGKENIDPNIVLTDSSSNAPMKVAKPKTIEVYVKMETLTDSICMSQKSILLSKVWKQ